MSILWCGGEDIDFPIGGITLTPNTANTTRFRPTYSRCSLNNTSSTLAARSNAFPGGAVTSAWITFQQYNNGGGVNLKGIAFGLSGTQKSLGVGLSTASNTRLSLFKWDGTTRTQLAAESGNSIPSGTLVRIDMQVINYGATATVNVYVNGALVINFTGDVTLSGMTNFDCVTLLEDNTVSMYVSEIIVSDLDTRSLQGLATLALTGAGTTNSWTNPTFTNINAAAFVDTTPTNSNTAAQDNEYNVTDLPTGTFSVLAVKETIRAAVSSTPTATQIKMGYKNGASIAFGTGATKTPAAAYGSLEQMDATDPTTGNAWLQADMNALQVDFQSA